MDDSVQVRCTKCKSNFREKARKIQSGYSKQCPRCEVIIFFEEGSIDKNIQRALNDAKSLRRALRAEDEASILRRTVLREEQTDEQPEERPTESARYIQTRSHAYFRR